MEALNNTKGELLEKRLRAHLRMGTTSMRRWHADHQFRDPQWLHCNPVKTLSFKHHKLSLKILRYKFVDPCAHQLM